MSSDIVSPFLFVTSVCVVILRYYEGFASTCISHALLFSNFRGRASIEPNFHDLYLKFLDKINSKALNKEIVQATYENCKVCCHSLGWFCI